MPGPEKLDFKIEVPKIRQVVKKSPNLKSLKTVERAFPSLGGITSDRSRKKYERKEFLKN